WHLFFERYKALEVTHTLRNLVVGDVEHTINRELLHRKGTHRRAVNHRSSHGAIIDGSGASEISNEAAGERIPCSRRIEHRLEWIRWGEEDVVFAEQKGSVLALLDDHVSGSSREDPARRLHEVHLFGELARLAIVQRDE